MTTVVGFISEKGGVGKTTTVYHVAVGLQRFHDLKVLVVDTDYQRGGLTCRLRPEMLESFRVGEVSTINLFHAFRSLYSAQQTRPAIETLSARDNIDLVPADPRLNSISLDKMPPANNLRDNNRMILRHFSLVRDCIDQVTSEETDYDIVLIDSHPDLDDLEKAVIFACDYCVSPVKLDNQSAVGVPSTVEAITDVDEDVEAANVLLNMDPSYARTKFLGAIGMMCREYGRALKYTEQLIHNRLRRTTGVFESYVTEGDGVRLAAQEGRSVYDISGANAEKQAEQFRALIGELLDKI